MKYGQLPVYTGFSTKEEQSTLFADATGKPSMVVPRSSDDIIRVLSSSFHLSTQTLFGFILRGLFL